MSAAKGQFFGERFVALAHRGGSLDRADADRENSLFAFQNAVSAGFRFLETDVRTTADGELLAFHDDELGEPPMVQGESASSAGRT